MFLLLRMEVESDSRRTLGVGNPLFVTFFPNLYTLVVSKGVKVDDVWDNSRGHGAWSLRFSRSFND